MGKKVFELCLVTLLAFILIVPAVHAGKANDTLNIIHPVELSSVDNYFNTDRLGGGSMPSPLGQPALPRF